MIDELERIRRFRAEEGDPSEEAQRAARKALEQAMLEASRPDSIRHRRRQWWLLRCAIAAIAAVSAGVILELTSSGSVTEPSPAAAAVLRQLAGVAAAGGSSVPGPGQYLYVDSESDYPSIAVGRHATCVTDAVQHRQVWIGSDGSGLLRETDRPATFTSAADRATCQPMVPSQLSGGSSNLWFAARCFSLGPTNDLESLSTNPRVLLRQMRRIDGGQPNAAEDFVHVGDFLRETDASPALRAALYRAAALIPGVRLLGPVRDHLGRLGLGVGYDSHGNRSELIFSPKTAGLMGEQVLSASASERSWAVYLQSRVVDGLPHPPPLRLAPPCVRGEGSIQQTRFGTVMTGGPGGSSQVGGQAQK